MTMNWTVKPTKKKKSNLRRAMKICRSIMLVAITQIKHRAILGSFPRSRGIV